MFCVYSLYAEPTSYAIDLMIIDTKAIENLEPSFLKKLDKETPLPAPAPMYSSESDEINSCGDWSKRIVLSVEDFSKKELLDTVDKTIDSIRLNDLERRVHINIVLTQETSYQTFIDILDLFAKKNTRVYGVHKEMIFWIE